MVHHELTKSGAALIGLQLTNGWIARLHELDELRMESVMRGPDLSTYFEGLELAPLSRVSRVEDLGSKGWWAG